MLSKDSKDYHYAFTLSNIINFVNALISKPRYSIGTFSASSIPSKGLSKPRLYNNILKKINPYLIRLIYYPSINYSIPLEVLEA